MLLAIVLLIGIVPVTSQAVTHTWCIDFDLDCACDYCAKPMHEGTTLEHDEYGHWIACARCGEGESDWELHYYDALTNDGNGNHSGSCIECGYQLVEEHIINS